MKFLGTVFIPASNDCATNVPPNVLLDPTGAAGRFVVMNFVAEILVN